MLEYRSKRASKLVDVSSIEGQTTLHPGIDISLAYSTAAKYLNLALEERLLGHQKKASSYCRNSQDIVDSALIEEPNLRVRLLVEKASIQLSSGKFNNAWGSVLDAFSYLKDHDSIDPYLRSYLHATEAVCLALQGKAEYAELAIDNSYESYPLERQVMSPFRSYSPLILLRQGQYNLISDVPNPMSRMHAARREAADLFPTDHLVLAYIDAFLAQEYLAAGKPEQAEKYFHLASATSVAQNYPKSNLQFRIELGLHQARAAFGETESAYIISNFAESIASIQEFSKQDFRDLFKFIFSSQLDYDDISVLLVDVEKIYSKKYGSKLDLDTEDWIRLALKQGHEGDFENAHESYSRAAKQLKSKPDLPVSSILAFNRLRFESSFITNDRSVAYESSIEILKTVLAAPELREQNTILAKAYTEAAIGAHLAGRHRRTLRYLGEASSLLAVSQEEDLDLRENILIFNASVAHEIGSFRTAEKLYSEVLSNFPIGSFAGTQSQLMTISLAWSQLRYGNIEACKETIEELPPLALDTVGSQLKAIKGYLIIAEKGDLKEASRLINEALEEYSEKYPPGNLNLGQAYRWQGDLYFASGDLEKAKSSYIRSERIFNRNQAVSCDRWQVNRQLSKVYGMLNKAEPARKNIKYARQLQSWLLKISKEFNLE